MRFRTGCVAVLLAGSAFVQAGCGDTDSGRTVITVYTSMYPEVISELKEVAEASLPDIELRFLQMGSEIVAARLNTELAAGNPQADLIMTSDPFWYDELKEHGHLAAYRSPQAERVPADLRDPEDYWVTVRLPVMVLACNSGSTGTCPDAFADLQDPAYDGKITMGDPLKSGTNFATVAALSDRYGWEFYEKLRANGIVASGGNSSTLRRVESREYPFGIVLLENLLAAQRKQNDVRIVYPEDTIIPVPSPIAILAASGKQDAAKRVYDFMFSEAGQRAIVSGFMYSPLPDVAPPAGAKPWSEISERMYVWSPERMQRVRSGQNEIKKRFTAVMQSGKAD